MRAFGFFLTQFGFFSASNYVTEIWLEWMAVAVASFFYILRLWVFFFNLFVPVLGILGCAGFSLAVVSGVYSPAAVWGLRIAGASLLRSTGSIAAAHGLSCSLACGIFLDQGSNLCLLHGWVDSLTLSHQGSPGSSFLDETPLTIMEFSAQPEATYFSAKAHRRGWWEDRCLFLGPCSVFLMY